MTTTKDPRLIGLMPRFMRGDETVQALSSALDDVFSRYDSAKGRAWDQIDSMSSEECDALADECRVLWYDSSAPVKVKREQLKESDKIWAKLGTRYAVELAASQVFGETHVAEFWEYHDGLPHHFKLTIERPGKLSDENVKTVLAMVEKVKRKSQLCDGVELTLRNEIPCFAGVVIHEATIEKYRK